MIAVRNDVLSETSGKQRPFESASLTGQFFFKPKPAQETGKSAATSDDVASLRQEIARLQADQGALLKSQQEQLAAHQKRLEQETKTAEPAAPQPEPPCGVAGADVPPATFEPLQRAGYRVDTVDERDSDVGHAHLIRVRDGLLEAGSDPRADGSAKAR